MKPFIYSLAFLGFVSVLSGCLAESAQDSIAEQAVYHHRVAALHVDAQDNYQVPRAFTGVINARQGIVLKQKPYFTDEKNPSY